MIASFLLAGCTLPWLVPPEGPVPDGSEPTAVTPAATPVSFAKLEERVNVLIAEATEADVRDRLIEARDLMHAMRGREPASQQRVYAYLERVLKIEERARVTPIEEKPPTGPMEEETISEDPVAVPVDPNAVLDAARAALAEGRPLDAVSMLDGMTASEALTIRKEAVDVWARAEREKAGEEFLRARAMPAGPERTAALRAVRDALDAINLRHPDNAYAAQIRDNLAKVDADLAAGSP